MVPQETFPVAPRLQVLVAGDCSGGYWKLLKISKWRWRQISEHKTKCSPVGTESWGFLGCAPVQREPCCGCPKRKLEGFLSAGPAAGCDSASVPCCPFALETLLINQISFDVMTVVLFTMIVYELIHNIKTRFMAEQTVCVSYGACHTQRVPSQLLLFAGISLAGCVSLTFWFQRSYYSLFPNVAQGPQAFWMTGINSLRCFC